MNDEKEKSSFAKKKKKMLIKTEIKIEDENKTIRTDIPMRRNNEEKMEESRKEKMKNIKNNQVVPVDILSEES